MKRLGVFLLTALAVSMAGAQWVEVNTGPGVWQGIYFVDSLNGWITSGVSNGCARTRDGGRTWTLLLPEVPPQAVGWNAVYFADTLHGIMAGSSGYGNGPGVIIRTTDGGQTWTQVTHPASNSRWEEIAVVGDSLWVVGSYWENSQSYYGLILRTPVSSLFSPAPIQWTFYQYPQFGTFYEVWVVSPQNVWIAGGRPVTLVRTTDGGATFINERDKLPAGLSRRVAELVFADSMHGWLSIDALPASSYATTNGGETWNFQTSWETWPAFVISDSGELFAADVDINGPPPVNGRIWKSTNYGASWVHIVDGVVNSDVANSFRLSNRHMWFVGGSSVWYYQYVEPPVVQPIPADTLRAGSVRQRQVQAQGMGLRYGLINSPSWVRVDTLTGLITEHPQLPDTGSFTITVQVRDTVWQTAFTSYNVWVKANHPPVLVGPGPDTVAIVDSLYRWQAEIEDYDGDPVAVDSFMLPPPLLLTFDPRPIVVEGIFRAVDSGRVYQCYLGLVDTLGGRLDISWTIHVRRPTSVQLADDRIPKEFALKQNYPNPFNPTTTIAFALPKQETVTLQVFDLLGRQVATLIDGKKLIPGTYEITWDGKDRYGAQAASGVYLYRIQTNSFSAIKKMVLLR